LIVTTACGEESRRKAPWLTAAGQVSIRTATSRASNGSSFCAFETAKLFFLDDAQKFELEDKIQVANFV